MGALAPPGAHITQVNGSAPASRGHRTFKQDIIPPTVDKLVANSVCGHTNLVPTAVVDQNILCRAGLIHMLAGTRYRIVANCSGIEDLPERVLKYKHVMILLGFDKKADCAFAKVLRLRSEHKNAHIVVLSEALTPEDVPTAIRAGINAYMVKDQLNTEALLKALEISAFHSMVVFEGLLQGQPSTSENRDFGNHSVQDRCDGATDTSVIVGAPTQLKYRLSPREHAILEYLMRGASNKVIARELAIAEATVKVHVKSLLRKVRVNNRTQAAMWGISCLEQNGVEERKSYGTSGFSSATARSKAY